MSELLLPLAVLLALGAQADAGDGTGDDPRAVVREATRAVEEERATAVRALWQLRLEREPTDRAAVLGLATLARLTYDYPTAEALYRRLHDAGAADRFAAYARLGQGTALEDRGLSNDAKVELTRARALGRARRDATAEGEALVALSFVAKVLKYQGKKDAAIPASLPAGRGAGGGVIPLRAPPNLGWWSAALLVAVLGAGGAAAYCLRMRRLRRLETHCASAPVVARTHHRYSEPGTSRRGSLTVTEARSVVSASTTFPSPLSTSSS